MYRHLIALTILCIASSLTVRSQTDSPINVDRSKVLSHYGDSEDLQLSLQVAEGVGVVAAQNIKRNGATALRIHFMVSQPTPTSTWAVQISDKHDKKIWSYSVVPGSALDFWSDEIPGDSAAIEVISVEPIPTLRLAIDRIIVSRGATMVKSLTVNKLKPIGDASPQIQQWGKSVARLLFVADGGGQFLCTGFLIADDLFMTNNHCIKTDSEMFSGLAEFDYDRPGMTPVTLRFKQLLLTNHDLDFSLLRLNTSSGRQPFTFDPNSLSENKPLVVIEHPAGRPKQVSIENCKVFGAQIPGVTTTLTDFGHGCDTLGGSSGSPVIDIATGKVLGLHHLGFLPNNQPVNRAVRIQQILDFLNQNLNDAAARQSLGLTPH